MVQKRRPSAYTKAIHDPRYAKLISDFRHHRIRLGMTQQQVADKIGMSRDWISKIERREVRLDVVCFVRYCGVCSVSPYRMLRHLTEGKPLPPGRFSLAYVELTGGTAMMLAASGYCVMTVAIMCGRVADFQ